MERDDILRQLALDYAVRLDEQNKFGGKGVLSDAQKFYAFLKGEKEGETNG